MPPKAKRSTKKKSKGNKKKESSAPSVEQASTTGQAASNTHNNVQNDSMSVQNGTMSVQNDTMSVQNDLNCVHVNDDKDRILRWLKSGRIDVKRAKKYMPNTTSDLRAGTCDPKALASSLASFYEENEKNKDDTLPYAAHSLVERVLSSVPNLDEYDELADEMAEDLEQKIKNEIRRFKVRLEPDRQIQQQLKEKAMKKALDSLCRSWESQLDENFYNGQQGSFLQNCGVYHEDFEAVLISLAGEAHETKAGIFKSICLEGSLHHVFHSIVEGFDREEDTCWHCGKATPSMKVCGECQVASFCGRPCMEEAWHSWHKHLCSKIRDDYQQYCDSIAAVDAAHVSGILPSGFELKDKFDYSVATINLTMPSPFKDNVRKKLCGPNMKYFYENMKHIVDGEWWLWDENVEPVEESSVSMVAGFLAYDYLGYAEKYLDVNDPALVTLHMFESSDFCVDGILENGPFMSRMDFLKAYSSAKRWKDAKDKKRELQVVKAKGLRNFRKAYQTGGNLLVGDSLGGG